MTIEQQRRVLVADDDPEVRRMLASVLEPQGLVVDGAINGRQAVDLLNENTYSVVLLDLLMPEIDGFGVLDRLQTEVIPAAPVVLVLTGADRQTVDRLDPQRIHGIVRKPFDPHELASLIVACANIRGRGAFETMAIATVLSGAQLLAWLVRH